MTKADDKMPIAVGEIGSPYGIYGWVKIRPFTELSSNLLEYRPWYLSQGSQWLKIEVEEGRIHGKGIIAKFMGYDTPETARLLTGKTIAIERTQLPTLKKDEYYWTDLQGLTVINKNGAILGTVSHLLATGSNDVLVVTGTKEHAIPYLPGEVVMSVDLVKNEIHVDWEIL
jgi:16S rRNA processing protein RimM